jgi:hypothetical protein
MVQQAGDEIRIMQQRLEILEATLRDVRSQLIRTHAGTRLVAGSITGILPAGSVVHPTVVFFINNSGGSLSDGDVVILDTTTPRAIKTSTTPGDTEVIGVVRDAPPQTVSPFAAGAETPVMLLGYHAAIDTDGVIADGDYLQVSSVAGSASSQGGTPTAGAFAQAQSVSAGGSSTVSAFVFGVALSSGGGTGTSTPGPPGMRGRQGERGRPGTPSASQPYTLAYFEATIAATGGYTCTADLYDTTDAAEVSGSPVTTTNVSATRVRSGVIVLSAAEHVYEARWGGPPGTGTFTIYSADIIVDTYQDGRRIARSYINLGINEAGQSVTP